MIDLWPYLMPVFLGGIVTCIGYIYNLKTEVAVLKKTLENLTALLIESIAAIFGGIIDAILDGIKWIGKTIKNFGQMVSFMFVNFYFKN